MKLIGGAIWVFQSRHMYKEIHLWPQRNIYSQKSFILHNRINEGSLLMEPYEFFQSKYMQKEIRIWPQRDIYSQNSFILYNRINGGILLMEPYDSFFQGRCKKRCTFDPKRIYIPKTPLCCCMQCRNAW